MRIYSVFAIGFILFSACGTDTSGSDTAVVESAIDSSYCDCSELTFERSYNHFWRFEKRKGFTGKCEEFYANGQVKTVKNLVDGKLHGKMTTYYDNGQVHEEREFDMNLQIGEQLIYTKKGEVKFHALYKRGVQQKVLVTRPDLLEEDPWEAN